jgi:hypothetical protein
MVVKIGEQNSIDSRSLFEKFSTLQNYQAPLDQFNLTNILPYTTF